MREEGKTEPPKPWRIKFVGGSKHGQTLHGQEPIGTCYRFALQSPPELREPNARFRYESYRWVSIDTANRLAVAEYFT